MPNLILVNGVKLFEIMADGRYKLSGVRTSKRFTLQQLKNMGKAVALGF